MEIEKKATTAGERESVCVLWCVCVCVPSLRADPHPIPTQLCMRGKKKESVGQKVRKAER
jgi:hypothetical protein